MKCFVSCVTKLPKFLPTMQCHVAPALESNSLLINCAISFSMLYFSMASDATSMACCCISSVISADLIWASSFSFFSVVILAPWAWGGGGLVVDMRYGDEAGGSRKSFEL